MVTPARVVYAVIFILFSLTCWLGGRTWDKQSLDLVSVQTAVVELKLTKLDAEQYKKDCELNRIALAEKATKEDMKRVDKRLTQILDLMLDPSKKEKIRAEQYRGNGG
jgi:hypothetical protein